jgi:hypothetical protein
MNTDRDYAAEYTAARTAFHRAASMTEGFAHQDEAKKIARAARKAGRELNELELESTAIRNAKN